MVNLSTCESAVLTYVIPLNIHSVMFWIWCVWCSSEWLSTVVPPYEQFSLIYKNVETQQCEAEFSPVLSKSGLPHYDKRHTANLKFLSKASLLCILQLAHSYYRRRCNFNAAAHFRGVLNSPEMSVFVFLLRHRVITINLLQEQGHFHTKEFLQMSQSYTQLNGGINIVSEKKKKSLSTHSCLWALKMHWCSKSL